MSLDSSRYVSPLPVKSWKPDLSAAEKQAAVAALEDGHVLFLPELAFALSEKEKRFLTPELVGSRKNVSYDQKTAKLGGCTCTGADAAELGTVMNRFATSARSLLESVLPGYSSKIVQGRTSLRPVQAAGRQSSWRKDDTRLHVDSFPATPVAGKRILRVFSNVNPKGEPRRWRVGEPFEDAARRFAKEISPPFPGSRTIMQLFRITRGHRSLYDHYMIQMHDRMKADNNYQETVPQFEFPFPAGATWIVFTDQVLHAVISGQHQFEQTFYLPIDAMANPAKSPFRVLERLLQKQMN